MRLYLKLFLAVLLAIVVHLRWDDLARLADVAELTVRVGVAVSLRGESCVSSDMMDMADRIEARQLARLGLHMIRPHVPVKWPQAIVPDERESIVCARAGVRWCQPGMKSRG